MKSIAYRRRQRQKRRRAERRAIKRSSHRTLKMCLSEESRLMLKSLGDSLGLDQEKLSRIFAAAAGPIQEAVAHMHEFGRALAASRYNLGPVIPDAHAFDMAGNYLGPATFDSIEMIEELPKPGPDFSLDSRTLPSFRVRGRILPWIHLEGTVEL